MSKDKEDKQIKRLDTQKSGDVGFLGGFRGPYLSEIQRDVHLVVLGAAGQRRALPPPLCAVNGVGDGMGPIVFLLAADVTVLPLRCQAQRKIRK